MIPSVDRLQKQLKQLPGLGHRSSERIALHLLLERPEKLGALVEALQGAARAVRRCDRCGHLAEDALCPICSDASRDGTVVCVVETVSDVAAFERAGGFRGVYHVLHGRLSPIQGVGPAQLNLASLFERVRSGEVKEIILALSNDVEGEATCHYLTEHLPASGGVSISRIGFGLPSGAGVVYADAVTLRSALEGRRQYS